MLLAIRRALSIVSTFAVSASAQDLAGIHIGESRPRALRLRPRTGNTLCSTESVGFGLC